MSANDSFHSVFDRLQEIERHKGIFLHRYSKPDRRKSPCRPSASAPGGTDGLPAVESAVNDDPRFIAIVHRVLGWSTRCEAAQSVRVVRIDNWFGPKWCRFAGKMVGALGVGGGRLVITTFVPARVDSETSWVRNGDTWSREEVCQPLHRRMSSAANLGRYFDLHCPATTALWFSSRSASNGRGAIMVYTSAGISGAGAWYVE